MTEIILKCGTVVLVDEEYYPLLSLYTWERYGNYGYAATKMPSVLEGKSYTIYLHKLVMAAHGFVDHKDGNVLDCRKQNMRKATRQQNGFNSKKMLSRKGCPTSSQYKGVMKVISKKNGEHWMVQIKTTPKGVKPARFIRLRPFYSEEDAALAYNEEIVKLRGEWAWLNTIPSAA